MATDHEDVRGHDFPKERRPPVTLPTMLGHVWPHARRDVEINRSHRLDERINKELKRRTRVVGICPNRDSLVRIVATLLNEQDA